MRATVQGYLDADVDHEDRIPVAELEKHRDAVLECAKILEDEESVHSPSRLVEIVRQKLTEQKTKSARLKTLNDEIAKMAGGRPDGVHSLKRRYDASTGELKRLKASLTSVEADVRTLQAKIGELGRESSKRNNVAEMISSIRQISRQVDLADEEGEKLQREEADLKVRLATNESLSVAQLLAEEQAKRMNVQNAIDGLRAEEEKRVSARKIFLREKRQTLNERLDVIGREKQALLQEREREQHMTDEVARLRVLITREERKPEVEMPTEDPVNVDRISRLVMLLLSDGPIGTVMASLKDELGWDDERVREIATLVRGANSGIAAQWADWLTKLVDSEK